MSSNRKTDDAVPLFRQKPRTRDSIVPPRWHYEFELNGVKTPIAVPEHAIRHRERFRYFFEPLVDLIGGSLRSKRVLDPGCNAGFWSLAAIEAGCDYVCGIDERDMHVEQSHLVFAVKGVESTRYSFVHADVLAEGSDRSDQFDIVLCLGLLYRINQPFN